MTKQEIKQYADCFTKSAKTRNAIEARDISRMEDLLGGIGGEYVWEDEAPYVIAYVGDYPEDCKVSRILVDKGVLKIELLAVESGYWDMLTYRGNVCQGQMDIIFDCMELKPEED